MMLEKALYEECIKVYESISPYEDPDDGHVYQELDLNRHWWEFTHEIERLVKLRRRVRRFLYRFGTFEWRHLYNTVNNDTERTIRGQKRMEMIELMKRVDTIIASACAEEDKDDLEFGATTMVPDVVFQLEGYPEKSTSKPNNNIKETKELVQKYDEILNKECDAIARSEVSLPDLVLGQTDGKRGDTKPDIQPCTEQTLVAQRAIQKDRPSLTVETQVLESVCATADDPAVENKSNSVSKAGKESSSTEAFSGTPTTKMEVSALFAKSDGSVVHQHEISPPKNMMQVADVEEMLENMIIQDIYDSPYVTENNSHDENTEKDSKGPKECLYDALANTDSGHVSENEVGDDIMQSVDTATYKNSVPMVKAEPTLVQQEDGGPIEEATLTLKECKLIETAESLPELKSCDARKRTTPTNTFSQASYAIVTDMPTFSDAALIEKNETSDHPVSKQLDMLISVKYADARCSEIRDYCTVINLPVENSNLPAAKNDASANPCEVEANVVSNKEVNSIEQSEEKISVASEKTVNGTEREGNARNEDAKQCSQEIDLSDKPIASNDDVKRTQSPSRQNEAISVTTSVDEANAAKSEAIYTSQASESHDATVKCPVVKSETSFEVVKDEEATDTEMSTETSYTMTTTLSMTSSGKQDKKCALM